MKQDQRPTRLAFPIVILLLLAGCGKQPTHERNAKESEEVHTIPLETIYSTNGQAEIRDVRRGLLESYGGDLEAICNKKAGAEAPSIFLVEGATFPNAVRATQSIVCSDRDVAGSTRSTELRIQGDCWLVAYLGNGGSEPPKWLIQAASRRGKIIQLSIVQPRRIAETADMHPYLVWVPLGKLVYRGIYRLELLNAETKEVQLTRHITIMPCE